MRGLGGVRKKEKKEPKKEERKEEKRRSKRKERCGEVAGRMSKGSGAIDGGVESSPTHLSFIYNEAEVEVEREGRDEVQGASGSGDEGSREVASAHDRYFRVPASNTPPRDR